MDGALRRESFGLMKAYQKCIIRRKNQSRDLCKSRTFWGFYQDGAIQAAILMRAIPMELVGWYNQFIGNA